MDLENSFLPGWLLDCTLQGSIAIVVVIGLMPLVRRFLGAQAAFWLWGIVLLRLLVPWLPPTPLHWGAPAIRAQLAPEVSWFSGAKVTTVVTTEKASVATRGTPKQEPSSPPHATSLDAPVQTLSWLRVVFTIWLAGLAVVLGVSLFRGIHAHLLVRRAREIPDDPRLAQVIDKLGTSRIRIKETGELPGPALTGLLRPTILLPLDWRARLTDSQLRCVFAHELGHFCRLDLLWRWAFLIARSLHWFNPLVWVAERQSRVDQEMACDEWVLLREQTSDPRIYGEALIASAQRRPHQGMAFPIQAGMAESHTGLKQRMRHLGAIRPHGWRAYATSLLLVATVIVLTGPAQSEPPTQEDQANIQDHSPSPIPPDDTKAAVEPEPSSTPRQRPKVRQVRSKSNRSLWKCRRKWPRRFSRALTTHRQASERSIRKILSRSFYAVWIRKRASI